MRSPWEHVEDCKIQQIGTSQSVWTDSDSTQISSDSIGLVRNMWGRVKTSLMEAMSRPTIGLPPFITGPRCLETLRNMLALVTFATRPNQEDMLISECYNLFLSHHNHLK